MACLQSTGRCAAARAAAPAKRTVRVRATAGEANWIPGSEKPAYLEGLPGNYGADPFKLGEDPANLAWYVQAELVHARFAMLGAAGILIPEALTSYGLWDVPPWYEAGATEFSFASPQTLFAVQLLWTGFAEYRRYYDFKNPGSMGLAQGAEGFSGTGVNGYPGGFFDPLGLSKSPKFEEYKVKEIANGRLAMVAMAGIYGSTTITGEGPLACLAKHQADPWHVTVLSEMWTKFGGEGTLN